MLAYTWSFPANSTLVNDVKSASKNAEFQSSQFQHEGCTFYLECTPNGYSQSNVPEGECTIWFAVESLADDVGYVDIKLRFECPEIGWSSVRSHPGFGRDVWSVGNNPGENIQTEQLSNLSSWTIKCYITKFKKKKKDPNAVDVDALRKLLALLQAQTAQQNSDDDRKNENNNSHGDDNGDANDNVNANVNANVNVNANANRNDNDNQNDDDNHNDDDDDDDDDDNDEDDHGAFFGKDDVDDGPPGFSFVGDGVSQKIEDIHFDANQPVASLKAEFADKMSCDPDEIGMLAFKDGKIVEIKYGTLTANGVTELNNVMVFKQDNRYDAVKKFIRQSKWKDEEFCKSADKWLKVSGNVGKAGVENLITQNGLQPSWNDLLSKRKYSDILKIIRNDQFAMDVDKLRTDPAERQKWGISDEEVKFIDFNEYQKIVTKTKTLREKFYGDMGQAALEGIEMSVDADSLGILLQFPPACNGNSFFGIISLIDAQDLKTMGIVCKGIDEIKKGKIYMYPGFDHDKKLQWKGGEGRPNVGTTSGGHWVLCEYVGIPPEFCAGFAIITPKLKFRSGTCNSSKIGKIKGFDNGKALNVILQECLTSAFKNTAVEKYYKVIDTSN